MAMKKKLLYRRKSLHIVSFVYESTTQIKKIYIYKHTLIFRHKLNTVNQFLSAKKGKCVQWFQNNSVWLHSNISAVYYFCWILSLYHSIGHCLRERLNADGSANLTTFYILDSIISNHLRVISKRKQSSCEYI